MQTSPAPVLQIGDPRLREVARPVSDPTSRDFLDAAARLAATLDAFRRAQGFGRAIAAPQIGVPLRFIAMNLGDGPFLVINPEITWSSAASFTMWDDCMSFPFLLVRVRRHASISVRFTDERGEVVRWDALDRARSELFQHEIDHLDGVLATDRAEGRDALVSREVYGANAELFRSQVDYVITP